MKFTVENIPIVGELLNNIYQHWFRDLVFFIAIAFEVFASQLILPGATINLNLHNLLVITGISIYWYSICLGYGFFINLFIAFTFVTNNMKPTLDLLYPLTFIFSGLSLFLASFIVYVSSFFGYCFHLRLSAFALTHLILFCLVTIAYRRVNNYSKRLSTIKK